MKLCLINCVLFSGAVENKHARSDRKKVQLHSGLYGVSKASLTLRALLELMKIVSFDAFSYPTVAFLNLSLCVFRPSPELSIYLDAFPDLLHNNVV